jgi:hypothetical protein
MLMLLIYRQVELDLYEYDVDILNQWLLVSQLECLHLHEQFEHVDVNYPVWKIDGHNGIEMDVLLCVFYAQISWRLA